MRHVQLGSCGSVRQLVVVWWWQIFDAVVIVTSFTVDVVFVGGVSGDHGQKAAAVLVVLPRPS